MQKNTFTDDELLEMLRLKAKQLKRTPKGDEFQQKQAIINRFGSWNNGILKAGLYLSNKQMLDLLKNELTRLNTTDDKVYNKNKSKEFPSVIVYEKRFHCSWQDLIKIIKPEKSKLKHNIKSRKELLNILIDLEKKLGHMPSSQEIKKYGYDESIFVDKFISYNNAVLAAKVESEINPVKETRTQLLQMYLDFCKKIGRLASAKDLDENDNIYNADIFRNQFGGMENLKKLAKETLLEYENIRYKKLKYSKLQLENILLKEYIRHGRRLTAKEINFNKELPEESTFLKYFKTTSLTKVWNEVLKDVYD